MEFSFKDAVAAPLGPDVDPALRKHAAVGRDGEGRARHHDHGHDDQLQDEHLPRNARRALRHLVCLDSFGRTCEQNERIGDWRHDLNKHRPSARRDSPHSTEVTKDVPMTITIDGDAVMVEGATVTQADIEASNGVIHVIDTVLMPQ